MPVLTNNYSTPFINIPYMADCQYSIGKKERSSSIVIGEAGLLNKRIHKLLDEYSGLKNNWDEEGALAPDIQAISHARNIVIILGRFSQQIFHCAPGPNGEIMLDIRNDKMTQSVEIILYKEKSIVVFFPEQGIPWQNEFQINQLSFMITN